VSCGTHVFKDRESASAMVEAADKLMYADKAKSRKIPGKE
jgi:hypothetical protein